MALKFWNRAIRRSYIRRVPVPFGVSETKVVGSVSWMMFFSTKIVPEKGGFAGGMRSGIETLSVTYSVLGVPSICCSGVGTSIGSGMDVSGLVSVGVGSSCVCS